MPKYLKNYNKETQGLINSIELTPLQKSIVEECLKYKLPWYGNIRIQDVFEDMYKLYVAGTSTATIAKIYDRNVRTIQGIFKKLGIERNKDVLLQTEVHSVLCKYLIPEEARGELEEKLLEIYKKHM